jgi:hypothetical protein
VGFPPDGYDGQFYYAIAQNPWAKHQGGEGESFDASRHLRFLYPVIAWLFSGGDACVLIWVMLLVNLSCVGGLAWLGARAAVHFGRSPMWGFSLPLAVNAGMPCLRDLTDPLAMFAACGLLFAWLLRSDWRVTALWGAAAVCSREQNVAIALLVLVGALWRGQRRLALGLGGTLLLWLTLVLVLRGVYGAWPFAPAQAALSTPGVGIFFRLKGILLYGHYPPPIAAIHAIGMLLLTIQIGLPLYYLTSRRVDSTITGFMVLGAVLALATDVYDDPWCYLRVFMWLPLGIWFAAMQTGQRWVPGLLLITSIWPLLAAFRWI